MNTSDNNHTAQGVSLEKIIIILALNMAFATLYFLLKPLDRTTLINWNWLFQDIGTFKIYAVFLAATTIATALWSLCNEKVYILFLSAIFFLSISIAAKAPEVIPDAARYFIQAKYLKIYGPLYFIQHWGKEIPLWTDLPLGSFLFGLSFKTVTENRLIVQAINVSLFLLTLIFTYRIALILWGKTTALFSVGLLMVVPYLTVQVPMLMVDILSMSMFSLILFRTIAVNRKRDLFILFVCLTLALLTKYSIWLFTLAIIIPSALLLHRKEKLKGLLLTLVAGYFLVTLLLLKDRILLRQLHLLWEFQLHGLYKWHEPSLWLTFFHGHPFFLLSCIAGTVMLLKEKHKVSFIFVIAITLFILIGRGRYILPLMPLLSLAGGYALGRLAKRLSLLVVGLAIVTSSFIVTVYCEEFNKYSFSNLQLMGQWLNQSDCEEIQVTVLPQKESLGQTAPMVALLDLYYQGHIISVAPWHFLEETFYHPLMFTWKIKRPPFYSARSFDPNIPTVVLGSSKADLKSTSVSFTNQSGHFRYKILLGVMEQHCAVRPSSQGVLSQMGQKS